MFESLFSLGKINPQGADEQSLNTLLSASNKVSESPNASAPIDDSDKNSLPKLSIKALGNVRLETLSWIQAIRRKYGLSETANAFDPNKIGRTASANKRLDAVMTKEWK